MRVTYLLYGVAIGIRDKGCEAFSVATGIPVAGQTGVVIITRFPSWLWEVEGVLWASSTPEACLPSVT